MRGDFQNPQRLCELRPQYVSEEHNISNNNRFIKN